MSASGPLVGITIADLSVAARRSIEELYELADAPEQLYRRRPLPQEEEKGPRRLDVPIGPLKRVQSGLLRSLFDRIAPHPYTACVSGRGQTWAAGQHAGALFLLHLDIAAFFPSVTRDRVFSRFVETGASYGVAWLLSRLVCLEDRLPQGAPTSNAVADMVLYPLDARLTGLARRDDLRYTRYIDDVALSGGPQLADSEAEAREIVHDEGWTLNSKGGLAQLGEGRRLLGLCIDSAEPTVGRQYIRHLRDDLRKAVKGIVAPTQSDLRSLAGRVTYVERNNPGRGANLRRRLEDVDGAQA